MKRQNTFDVVSISQSKQKNSRVAFNPLQRFKSNAQHGTKSPLTSTVESMQAHEHWFSKRKKSYLATLVPNTSFASPKKDKQEKENQGEW